MAVITLRHRRVLAVAAVVISTLLLFAFVGGIGTGANAPLRKYEPNNSKVPIHQVPNENVDNLQLLPKKPKAPKYLPPKRNISIDDLEKTIDLMQAKTLDWLNGEEGKADETTPYGIFGGSLLDTRDHPFNVRTTWNRVHQYALHVASNATYPRGDILQLARRTRALLIAYTLLYDEPSLIPLLAIATTSDRTATAAVAKDALTAELQNVVGAITKELYPWLWPTFTSIRALQDHFLDTKKSMTAEVGLVFTTGQWHFELALHAILSLRDVLNSTLPVEVLYMGPGDLTPSMISAFDSIPNVRTVDVTQIFHPNDIGGWAAKPYSILASHFRVPIFVDADVLFFVDPREMASASMLLREFGQLFYHDRSIGRDDPVEWFRSIDPHMSRYAKGLRYTNGLSSHEMESGVVVIDKGRTGALHALLMVCQMNGKEERDVAYKHMHGDKETFWMSWDMIRVPFKFTPTYGGTVGYMNEKKQVCGGLFHTDEYQRPLWWNGGVLKNKHHHKDSNFMEFTHAAFDTDAEKLEWVWETETSPFCLMPGHPEKEVVELNSVERRVGGEFVVLYKQIRENGWQAYMKTRFGGNY